MSDKQHVVIVGAGEFGSSTALSLLQSGKYTVTLLDRAAELPAMDAASTDINKVVRFDYAEREYADLCAEAIKRWKKDFPGVYHESGVVISGTPAEYDTPTAPIREVFTNARAHAPITDLASSESFSKVLDPSRTGISRAQVGRVGYFNPIGGWANAALGVQRLYEKIAAVGGCELVPSAPAKSLIYDKRGNDVVGVTTEDGRQFHGDKVILAMGSWTGPFMKQQGLFPDDPEKLLATGIGLGAFQLSAEDAKRYKDVPVIMAWDGSGFYCFPPNETGMMKFALHAAGYGTESGVPRTSLTEGTKEWHAENGKTWIPRDMARVLREEIALFYPELAERPFDFTRMCYYSDTVDGHWLIDYHPHIPSLMIASGGSGHAYKFLPVIGELIHARLENRLDPMWTKKWAVEGREAGEADKGRGAGKRRVLKLDDFAGVMEVPKVKQAKL